MFIQRTHKLLFFFISRTYVYSASLRKKLYLCPHAHTRIHTHTLARTHIHTRARTHARTHTLTRAHARSRDTHTHVSYLFIICIFLFSCNDKECIFHWNRLEVVLNTHTHHLFTWHLSYKHHEIKYVCHVVKYKHDYVLLTTRLISELKYEFIITRTQWKVHSRIKIQTHVSFQLFWHLCRFLSWFRSEHFITEEELLWIMDSMVFELLMLD